MFDIGKFGNGMNSRTYQTACRVILAASVIGCWIGCAGGLGVSVASAAPTKIKIAVFPFELEDFSAAQQEGTSPVETAYLGKSTKEAKQLLAQSGRYSVIDTSGADMGPTHGQALRNCKGCEAAIATKLGADQVLIGEITKISMTEYVVNIQVSDAPSGKIISRFTTSLRIGADYSWPRGVRWLVQNRMLAEK